jgi:hypothetical protein
MPILYNEFFKDPPRTLEGILAFEEGHKDIGCQVSKVLSRNISERGQT